MKLAKILPIAPQKEVYNILFQLLDQAITELHQENLPAVRLHGQQESIINTGDIECRMVIILIAEIECLDQLAVFRSAAVIIEMLPAAGRPSIRIRIGRRLIHKAADIVSPITGIDIMSQIGCCLIIIVRTLTEIFL